MHLINIIVLDSRKCVNVICLLKYQTVLTVDCVTVFYNFIKNETVAKSFGTVKIVSIQKRYSLTEYFAEDYPKILIFEKT